MLVVEHHFAVVLFIMLYQVVLTFESVDVAIQIKALSLLAILFKHSFV